VDYLLSLAIFVVLAAVSYASISGKAGPGGGAAVLFALLAAIPLLDGGLILFKEYGRYEHGRVVAGVVVEKLSSTGAEGSRTIGSRRWQTSRRTPAVLTGDGFTLPDVVARMMVTGSTDAWVVDYRSPCGSAGGCWQRDFVSRALWYELRSGQMVNVKTAKSLNDSGRLDQNPMWPIALAKVAIGGTLALLAGLVSGRLTRRRRKFVTTPAIVTSVEPVAAGGWRIGFAYFSPDGAACENADEVYVAGVKPGDSCTAVYPADRPDLGTLSLTKT
jgi:hypothetical protein